MAQFFFFDLDSEELSEPFATRGRASAEAEKAARCGFDAEVEAAFDWMRWPDGVEGFGEKSRVCVIVGTKDELREHCRDTLCYDWVELPGGLAD